MYTATLKDKGTLRDKITLQVEFDNKVAEPFTENFTGRTSHEINRSIAIYLENLDKRDADLEGLTMGVFTAPVEEPKSEPVPPTKEELAETAWNDTKSKLEQALALKKMAEEAGRPVDPARQGEIDALAEYVDTNFKSEYVK